MPGDPHPFEEVLHITPPAAVDKGELLADAKLGIRRTVADADEIRNTDFSGQFGGVYVRDLQSSYDLNSDSTALDDGDSCIIDAAGNHFIKLTAGSSELIERVITDSDVVAGEVAVEAADDVMLFNVTQPVTVTFPPAADRNGRKLTLKDVSGNASTNTITPEFDGAELCDGLPGSSFPVASNYGWQSFRPKTGGWYQLTD